MASSIDSLADGLGLNAVKDNHKQGMHRPAKGGCGTSVQLCGLGLKV